MEVNAIHSAVFETSMLSRFVGYVLHLLEEANIHAQPFRPDYAASFSWLAETTTITESVKRIPETS